jgi:hypothetical protein
MIYPNVELPTGHVPALGADDSAILSKPGVFDHHTCARRQGARQ